MARIIKFPFLTTHEALAMRLDSEYGRAWLMARADFYVVSGRAAPLYVIYSDALAPKLLAH